MKKMYYYYLLLMASSIAFVACEDQVGDTMLPATVTVELDGKAGTRVTANFTPSKETVRFTYGIGLAKDKPAFKNGTIAGFGESTEAVSIIFTELEANMPYLIYTQGFDANDKPGPILTIVASTVNSQARGIVQYIAESEVSINFVSNDTYYKLGYAIGLPGKLEEFKNGYMDETFIVEQNVSYVRIGDLVPDTEYVIYTKSFPRNVEERPVYSEVKFKTFAIGACPKVELNVVDMSVATGFFTFTANEHVSKYSVLIQEEGERDNILNNISWKNDLQSTLASWSRVPQIGMTTVEGNATLDIKRVFPDLLQTVAYEALILCYDKDGNVAQCYEYKGFSTPSFSYHRNFANVKVEHKEFNVAEKYIEITFTPNPNTIAYMYEILDDEYYQKMIAHTDYNEYSIPKNLYDNGYANTIRLITPNSPVIIGDPTTSMQPLTYAYQDNTFKYNTQYYIVACPLNKSGHTPGWERAVIVPFTTPAAPGI